MRVLLLLLTFVFTSHTLSAQVLTSKSYENGLVVSAEKHASEIGRDILKQGGNAVDAAVAVQFALAVTLPRAGNIGGGGFMVIRLADGETTTLDFREKAPLQSYRDMYVRNGEVDSDLSWEGILAVGVPGTVDGMVKALERYGRMPLDVVMEPAIRLAREGYRLSYTQANDLNNHRDTFKKYQASAKYFTTGDTTLFKEGDLFVQTDLATTLERIARFGREGFYSGPVADAIVREMKRYRGIIEYKDLREYESVWRDAVTTEFMGYELHIMPPPSSGSVAIAQILEMIEDYPLKEMGHNSAEYVHVVAEAMRRAFADRAYYLGDPDFVDIPMEQLVSESYNNQRMESFSADTVTPSSSLSHGDIPGYSESSQTTHYSVVDADGNAVSVTTTLNGSFGSHVSVSGAGFLLNNEMDDFSAQPGEPNQYGLIGAEANAIEPGKRMLSSMTPAIVTKDDKVDMILGAAGGPRIITATLQSFLNRAVFDMRPMQATAAARFHHQWLPEVLFFGDFGLSPDTRALLEAKGHRLFPMPGIGRAHNIYRNDDGLWTGAPDPRADGSAEGY
ncbi:gamma-glutamyltransferase [Gracilimonas mengyeensis]|uniref:Glutathione hydrolase proenzyme n=1 Tax=Gracilimonas mengyeensis TaxID=1302730 RepID=A0A521C2W7_9BACT|nr:gamma-glutamyltransferase [Gracilimonas mengyeensis]SMO53744.1 gamma-glutamyltranspeptidase / glutathione hydrolase [Gracilimonas mengyeensis]